MVEREKAPKRSNFRRFFLRGLAIVLPSVLTIWLLFIVYNFLQEKIARPINQGVRWAILTATPWPAPALDIAALPADKPLSAEEQNKWQATLDQKRRQEWQAAGYSIRWLQDENRQRRLTAWWKRYAIGMDLIGLAGAVVVIYVVGAFLGSFIGRRLYHRGEELVAKVPLIRQVYPSVKQVTDFLTGGDNSQAMQFNRVVAVQYPRKGLWSVGLVTGDTMHLIQEKAGAPCMTVFIPSSPTPFTGYVITVPKTDTIDLPISVEQALRFTVSGGVIIPPTQIINEEPAKPEQLPRVRDASQLDAAG